MTDDPTGAEDATDDGTSAGTPSTIPDGDSALPTTDAPATTPGAIGDDWLAQAPPPTAPPLDPAVASLAPLAAGTSPGWYRTTVGNDLRWWDGAAWTDRTTPGEEEKAGYGQRYLRRLPVVLLVVAVLNALTALVRLTQPSLFPTFGGTATAAWYVGLGLGIAFGLLAASALWDLVVAAFPGRKVPADEPRRPFLLRAWPWAIVATIVAVPIVTYSFLHTPPVDIATIASTKDGCNAYLDTVEKLATENVTNAKVTASLQALHDAALEHDPQLAADLQPVIADPSGANSATATKAILTRCVDNGDLTTTEIQTWAARIQAVLDKAGG